MRAIDVIKINNNTHWCGCYKKIFSLFFKYVFDTCGNFINKLFKKELEKQTNLLYICYIYIPPVLRFWAI